MRLKAILRQRCPHCLQGGVFNGFLSMRSTCPLCGITYEREQGYFLMAMFVGYVFDLFLCAPLVVWLLINEAPLSWYLVSLPICLIVFAQPVFRYARVVWMHLDELLDPRRPEELGVRRET
jgi:uncharacterized protein (DUF983 family)